MSTAVLLLVAILGFAGFLYWLDRMIESDRVGLYLVLGIAALDVLAEPPRFEPGGLSVDHLDLLLVVLIASLLARLLRGWRPSAMVSMVILIFVLVTFSVGRGAQLFGAPAAINEARDTLYLFATILYASFLSADVLTRRDVARAWLLFCQALVAISLLRWFIVLSGLPLLGMWHSPDYWGLRVVTSSESLSIAQGALILLPRLLRGEATKREWQMVIAFCVAVLVLQHRSVYIVLFCGAAVMVARHRFMLSRRFVLVMIGGTLAVSGIFVTLLDDANVGSQAAELDTSNTDTFEWRAEGWAALIRDSGPSTPETWLFGAPYGTGYDRVLPTGARVDVPPHNHYLEMLLRIGVVGLGLILFVGVSVWARLRRVQPAVGDELLSDSTLAALFITYMLYMIPYNIVMETGVLIGLSLSAWARLPPVRSRASLPTTNSSPPIAPTYTPW